MAYKVSFIINPVSGGGEGKRIFGFLPEIMASFDMPREKWHGEYTDPKGFEAQLKRILPLTEKLIVVGGDGTMNLVLQSIADQKCFDVQVGVIPLGTGNDLSRAMCIQANYSHKGLLNTVRKLVAATPRSFDLWRIDNNKIMAAYLSIGVDAKIAHIFDKTRKSGKLPINAAWFNKLVYLYLPLKVGGYKIKPGAHLKVMTKEGQEINSDVSNHSCCLIGNIPSYAAGAKPFNSCSYSDKQLEVVACKSMLKYITMVSTAIAGAFGKYLIKAFVPADQVVSVDLNIPKGEYVQLDGEDVSADFGGRNINIHWAGKAKILTLDN